MSLLNNTTLINATLNSTNADVSLIKHSGSIWIYGAYIFLLISYVIKNILFVRIVLIFGVSCFGIYAIVVGNIFLDSLLWNIVFVLINAYRAYPLLLEYLDFKLERLEDKIFNEHFKTEMTKRNFDYLIKKSVLRYYADGSEITHYGNSFDCIYFVALIHPDYEVKLYKRGEEISIIKENSWIGVVESMKYFEGNENQKEDMSLKVKSSTLIASSLNVKWDVDCKVKVKSDRKGLSQVEKGSIYDEYKNPCWVYCFDISDLSKLFEESEGAFFRNSLYSIWLSYTSKVIERMDRNLIQAYRRNEPEIKNISSNNEKDTISFNIELPMENVADDLVQEMSRLKEDEKDF